MGSKGPERRLKADSVCVIGAGPSGLAAAKYLVAERGFSRISVIEQRSRVGGIWNYVPCPDITSLDLSIPQTSPHAARDKPIWTANRLGTLEKPEAAFMTPLYDRLETNIPRGLMSFSDLDWPEDCQLFPPHKQVLEYIDQYADDVRHLIRFQTQVLDVRLHADNKWAVKTQALTPDGNDKSEEEIYDAVIVASGHFNVHYIPDVPGIKEWNAAYPGSITHSKFYRLPEHYAGKKVIVVGNSASGIDIGAQIQPLCKTPLIMSQKSESFLVNQTSATKIDKPPITEYIVTGRTVRFADGTAESGVDAVLYCTGYFYSLPFLDTLDPPVITTGERVEGLYQHVFHQRHPTLSFLVLNQRVIPFPMAEAQASVIARSLSGRLALPTEEAMRRWEEEAIRELGAGRGFHILGFPKDADYINMLHDWALTADGEGRGRAKDAELVGKEESCRGRAPPYWGEMEYWTRERFPQIKKTFGDLGDERHNKRTLDDIGYSFHAYKDERLG